MRCWFADGIGLAECFAIPESKHWEIEHFGEYERDDSTEYDRDKYFVEYWLTTHPAPSWMVVAEALYVQGDEDTLMALEVVRRKYLTGRVCSMCVHMSCMYDFVQVFRQYFELCGLACMVPDSLHVTQTFIICNVSVRPGLMPD